MLNPKLINDALEKSAIITINTQRQFFTDVTIDAIDKLTKQFDRVCFVTLSKPYGTVLKNLEKGKIDVSKIFFIDTLTATVSNPPEADNCIFIETPNDLTTIALSISEAQNFGCQAVFIDAIPILKIYNDEESLVKFVNSVMNKILVNNNKAILMLIQEDGENAITEAIMDLSDKVIEVKK